MQTSWKAKPSPPLPRLFQLNVPEQSDDALAQRHQPTSFARLALGIEIEGTLPDYLLQAHSDHLPVSQAGVQHNGQDVSQRPWTRSQESSFVLHSHHTIPGEDLDRLDSWHFTNKLPVACFAQPPAQCPDGAIPAVGPFVKFRGFNII
jgi:hypothetical protein